MSVSVRNIYEKELENLQERSNAYVEDFIESNYEKFNYQEIIDLYEDSYYYFLESEYGKVIDDIDDTDDEWFIDELLANFVNKFEANLIKKAIDKIEDFFSEGYQTIGLILGVQHITIPYNYYPSYKVLSKKLLTEEGLKELLEKNEVPPHAWGILSSYDNWGNYWFIILNKSNYKNMIEDDLDVALAVLSQYPETVYDD